MFKCEIKQEKTGAIDTFYFVAEEGKRWLLKSLLEATGQYKKNLDNQYTFDTDKVIGCNVLAEIYHEEQPWTDSTGKETTVKNNRIKIFKKSEYTQEPKIEGSDEECPF